MPGEPTLLSSLQNRRFFSSTEACGMLWGIKRENWWRTGTGLPVKTVSGQGFGSPVVLMQILILSFAIKETGNERSASFSQNW